MRNVLLVCLDSVRKDYYDQHATRLCDRSVIDFSQCRSVSGWSVPSHASMVTGQLPHQHGIHVYHRHYERLDRDDTFFGRLPDHRAIGASANVFASEAFGFDRLFDDFVSVSPDRRFPRGIDVERFGQGCDAAGLRRYLAFVRAAAAHDHPIRSLANGTLVEIDNRLATLPFRKPLDDGAGVVSRAARDLVDRTDEPFVLFTNFMDAHGPLTPVRGYDPSLYDVPANWSTTSYDTTALNAGDPDDYREEIERTRDLYAAAVEYLDRQVSALVDDVQAATGRETVAVVTADHGDNLAFEADDGLVAHMGVLTEGLLHVPCTVIGPSDGASLGLDAVDPDRYLSHLRLGDLVTSLARGDPVPEITAEAIPAERIGSNVSADATPEHRREWDRMIRVVYEETLKYRWDSAGDRDRYELDPDRACWQRRLDGSVPVDELEPRFFDDPIDRYKDRARGAADDADVSPETEQRLRDLGYA